MKKIIRVFSVAFFLISNISFSQQWVLRYPDIPTDFINDIIFLNENDGFIVNDGGSILKTTDGGDSWKIIQHFQRNKLTEIKFIDEQTGFILSPYSHLDDDLDLIYTTNGGRNWQESNVDFSESLVIDTRFIFQPLSKSKILKTSNFGGLIEKLDNFYGNWEIVYEMPAIPNDYYQPYGDIFQFQKLNSKILALGSSYKAKEVGIITDSISFFLESTDEGSTWDTLWCGLPYVASCSFFLNDSVGWMGMEYNKIYKTVDGGKSWIELYSDSTSETSIKSIFAINADVFAIDGSGKIIYSKNEGSDWQTYQLDNLYSNSYKIQFLNENKGFVIGRNFWQTTDGGDSWNRVSKSLSGNLSKIDFVNENIGMGIGERFVYGTSDGGYNWKIVLNNGDYFSGLEVLDAQNAWVVGNNTLYQTTNGGTSWSPFQLSDGTIYTEGIIFLDDLGVAYEVWEDNSTFNYVTTDGGKTWNKNLVGNTQLLSSFLKMKFTDPEHLWATNQDGIWLSRDTATTWELFRVERAFGAFDFVDSLNGWVSLGPFDKMAYTTDGGITWEIVDKPYSAQPEDVLIYRKGNYFGGLVTFVAGHEGSLLRFTQGDWYVYDIQTYTGQPLHSFASYQEGNILHIWLAGYGMTVLHYITSVTTIKDELKQNILSFSLYQNYPNPFNPSTKIKFVIPKSSFVNLKVYDVLGREVATLVNEEKSVGEYEVEFDGSELSSGIYFYVLNTEGKRLSKKMCLIK